jgi:hypothetical protein
MRVWPVIRRSDGRPERGSLGGVLVNGKRLPGPDQAGQAPQLGLHEVFSRGKQGQPGTQDPRPQVAGVLGLVHAHRLNHWTDWQAMRPLLLARSKRPTAAARCGQVSYPLGERPGHHLRLRDADRPGAGSRCRRPCSLCHSLARVVAQRQQPAAARHRRHSGPAADRHHRHRELCSAAPNCSRI